MPFMALPDLAKGPKYKRTGLAAKTYFAGFFLDLALFFGVGYGQGWLLIAITFEFTPWIFVPLFLLTQTTGYAICCMYLACSFTWHKVRRWWLQLVLHLLFAYAFQAGYFIPYLPQFEAGLLNNQIGPYIWLCWALSVPLLVKSIGLWWTIHPALRVYYPAQGQYKGCWATENRWYFQPNSAKQIYQALEQGNIMHLHSKSAKPPEQFPSIWRSFAVLTLSIHPTNPEGFPIYIHLKDVWFSGLPIFYKCIHRAAGFSRVHHVELSFQEYIALTEYLNHSK